MTSILKSCENAPWLLASVVFVTFGVSDKEGMLVSFSSIFVAFEAAPATTGTMSINEVHA